VRSLNFEIDMPDRAAFERWLTEAILSGNNLHGVHVATAVGPLWPDLSTVTWTA
jgi:hypothetical protein